MITMALCKNKKNFRLELCEADHKQHGWPLSVLKSKNQSSCSVHGRTLLFVAAYPPGSLSVILKA